MVEYRQVNSKYLRASKKQLDYIEVLCQQLGVRNPTLYSRYTIDKAAALINSLKRKRDAKQEVDNQTRLL
jgi:hypothetical protein